MSFDLIYIAESAGLLIVATLGTYLLVRRSGIRAPHRDRR